MQQSLLKLKEFLDYKIFALSGQSVTPFVLLAFVAVVALTILAGGLLKRLINRRLTRLDEKAVLDNPQPVVRFKEFGDSSLNFELLA